MGDPRNPILKDLLNSFHYLESFKKFHLQCIDSEKRGLRQSMENWETAHRTFERLGNMQDLQALWIEHHRQQKKILSTIHKLLDFNLDLRGTKYYLEATDIIQGQKSLECPNTEQMKGPP
ncbi:hypothetical protein KR038_010987, partial [Drosophila bunnanda]